MPVIKSMSVNRLNTEGDTNYQVNYVNGVRG